MTYAKPKNNTEVQACRLAEYSVYQAFLTKKNDLPEIFDSQYMFMMDIYR